MYKIGICMSDFGPQQLAYDFITRTNALLQKTWEINVCGFYENLVKPLTTPAFGLFNLTEAYGFDGVLVTTSALLTHQSLKWPRPSKRIYFVNDLEWIRFRLPAEFYIDVFKSGVEIQTRSEDYAQILKNNFNVEAKLNPNFDIEKFL